MERTIAGFNEIFLDLIDDCSSFDSGQERKARSIAGRLRTLLKNGPSKSTVSLLTQLGKADIPFKDSSIPYSIKPGLSNFDNVRFSNCHIYVSGVYMGLVYKKMDGENETANYSFAPMFTRSSLRPQISEKTFDEWWNQIIYEDPNLKLKLSRKDLILSCAEQDGYAHFDKESRLNPNYKSFIQSDSLHFVINKTKIWFLNSPAKNSIRQIGYEVIETFQEHLKDNILANQCSSN